ncbi:phosphoribosylglycinamide formyltransferase [Castellaniella sp. GW247-6E4]|uniref:phosphoribosylglycinamide formyltransferase n=1 Tax=Castellaniella sp. GW247-6E4 TaxID=3140380 RepID=UPI003314CCE1
MLEAETLAQQPGSPVRFLILISGRGSNMQAIVQAIAARGLPAEVCAVLSNRPDAAGLEWARSRGIPAETLSHRAFDSREAFDQALAQRIDELAPDYVLLAGFMRVLGADLVRRFEGRIVNIHPSLLPAFPGLHTHAQALAQGVQWHGCTVHFVTPVLDHGPIIAQGAIPVLPGDTADALAGRLLALEHHVYTEVAAWLARRQVSIGGDGLVRVAGAERRAFTAHDLTP